MFRKLLVIFSAAAFFTVGCSSTDDKLDTAEAVFAKAQELEKDERYEEAIQKYTDVKNKFPYSKLAPQAELAIGDVHFKQEAFPEAQAAYTVFKELHPKHTQIDYVTFRVGLSYYNQLPPTIDRDLSVAYSAIRSFDEVLTKFSSSPHATEAREKKMTALKMLAEKEIYIADFYFKRENWDSALIRYEGVAKGHAGLGFDAKALAYGAVSARRLGELKKSEELMAKLKKEFPNSEEYSFAEKEIK